MARRRKGRLGRAVRLAACVPLGLVVGLTAYVGLIQAGVVRSPFAPVLGGDVALATGDRPGLRVLFVGNSLTHENGMPAMVRELAEHDAGAPPVFAVEYAAGGWRLSKAARDRGLARLLTLRWDAVVLQEQSYVASSPRAYLREFLPAARALDRRIRVRGARAILYMTWGYENGDGWSSDGDTYAAMQSRLADSYRGVASRLGATVAPVGEAWSEALARDPALELWASDGMHPSRRGSYLAACVLYGTLTGRDPRRSTFTAGLGEREAQLLQSVAADLVGQSASSR